MNKTRIEWCDYTINPVKGLCPMHCKTPEGYEYCYAAGGRGLYKRFKWDPEIRYDPAAWLGLGSLRKPVRIFVGSTFELFGDWTKPDWMRWIMEVPTEFPQHTFIFLTKQPENLPHEFPPNCWVGVSAWDAKSIITACTHLQDIEAKDKWLSVEPMYGHCGVKPSFLEIAGIKWVVIGSQTQPVKHPPREWVDEIINAADKAETHVFVKNPLAEHLNIQRKEFPGEGVRGQRFSDEGGGHAR